MPTVIQHTKYLPMLCNENKQYQCTDEVNFNKKVGQIHWLINKYHKLILERASRQNQTNTWNIRSISLLNNDTISILIFYSKLVSIVDHQPYYSKTIPFISLSISTDERCFTAITQTTLTVGHTHPKNYFALFIR